MNSKKLALSVQADHSLKLEQSLGFLHKLAKKEQVERKASLREPVTGKGCKVGIRLNPSDQLA